MSYQADLLNAYRDQLARIRAAFKDLEFEECDMVHGYGDLEIAINSTEADDLENLYVSKDPPVILPDGPTPHISTENMKGEE